MSTKLKVTRAFREELKALLTRHGFDLLVDDGMWLWRDDYTDSCLVYMRPSGWFKDWKARHDTHTWTPVAEAEANKKADPVQEPAVVTTGNDPDVLGCGCGQRYCWCK